MKTLSPLARWFITLSLPFFLSTSFTFALETETKKVLNLTPILAQENFWQLDKKSLQSQLAQGYFKWTSKEETEFRGAGFMMSYLDLPVLEIIFYFQQDKLSEVFLSLYNKGDAGTITDKEFEAFITSTVAALNLASSASAEDLGDAIKRPTVRAESKAWRSPTVSYRLDTAYSRVKDAGSSKRMERPEFVNLTYYPGGLDKEALLVNRQAKAELVNSNERLNRRANQDVILVGVPMVDQGQKGYCAVATMERILRFYGSEINQHELAQQANSSGQGGTDMDSLIKSLKGMSATLGLRTDELINSDVKDFYDLVADYNRLAKRQKRSQIDLDGLSVINIGQIYGLMDPELILEVKTKNASKVQRFMTNVSETIELGRPLAWTVQLGWIEETPKLPQIAGGHMRLIIGYNASTQEILYSDSWGMGHEEKRMSLNNAYTMTKGLFVIEPRQ